MVIVADSGSTKTLWASPSLPPSAWLHTEGLNPHFTSDEAYKAVFDRVRAYFGSAAALWFYGAGCGHQGQAARVGALALSCGVASEVHVETDLLGAARALLGHEAGYVGILGTGSNCCYYDGSTILRRATSAGFILGDHGSANHVGRLLLRDYLCCAMPDEVSCAFREAFPYSPDEWIDRVYHQPYPNRFLASLAPFATRRTTCPYCAALVRQSLTEWVRFQVRPLVEQAGPIGVVGGMAASAAALLPPLVEGCGLHLGQVLSDPMPSLLCYHSSAC